VIRISFIVVVCDKNGCDGFYENEKAREDMKSIRASCVRGLFGYVAFVMNWPSATNQPLTREEA
jgi:hypothetical protein